MGIIWVIIIGFLAGTLAKYVMPVSDEPAGFVLSTILGILGAILASILGQVLGLYAPGQGAGVIGAALGAIIALNLWGLANRRV